MCGINRIWTTNGRQYKEIAFNLSNATDALKHRGPDDRGIWVDQKRGVFLGHRRLSVVDLSPAGHQPMVTRSGKHCIVFNGEIYNYIEIRQFLTEKGCHFQGESDTEVLLSLYEYEGLDFIHRLQGMFAFAIWDAYSQRLILSRDRVGKKPLYYSLTGNSIFFCSEINALRSLLPAEGFNLDYESLDSYLTFGLINGERTIYKNIKELLPGTIAICDAPGKMVKKKYWAVDWHKKRGISFDEAVNETEACLRESINLRLRADVPLGVLLSGGIDSGLVTAMAARSGRDEIKTFCVGFEGSAYDERPLAKSVAEMYGTEHHEIVLTPDIVSFLPSIISAYGEPFADASAIPTYFVARYVSQHTKVVLTGDGGDELFCGYRRHVATSLLEKIHSLLPASDCRKFATLILKLLPVPEKSRTKHAFLYRFLRGVSADPNEGGIIFSSDGFDFQEKTSLYKEKITANTECDFTPSAFQDYFDLNALDRTLAIDFVSGLPDGLLVKMDIGTMSHGLEARSPFLDQHMISSAFSIPNKVKLPSFTTKPLLRAIAKRYLPNSIVHAPKRGFEIPLLKWLNEDLCEMRDDLILSQTGLLADLFQRTFLESLLRGKEKAKLDSARWANLIWILLVLAIWSRECPWQARQK